MYRMLGNIRDLKEREFVLYSSNNMGHEQLGNLARIMKCEEIETRKRSYCNISLGRVLRLYRRKGPEWEAGELGSKLGVPLDSKERRKDDELKIDLYVGEGQIRDYLGKKGYRKSHMDAVFMELEKIQTGKKERRKRK